MRYFAVIDTNVLVSALLRFDSIPGQTVQEALGGAIVPLLSKEILAEYGEVLRRAKFPLAEQDILDVLSGIQACGLNVELDQIPLETPDPDDAVFYAVVMQKRKDADAYLVTGNLRHFPRKPFIVTPREMLDIIKTGQAQET